MPKKKAVDDLEDELEDTEEAGDEDEEEDEEESEEAEDESEEEDEEESEEEEAEEKPKKRGPGRPKGSGTKSGSGNIKKGKLIGVVLRNGMPKRVQIIKVMGRNVRATKVGEKDETKALRIPISDVFEYEEDIFDKMMARAEKIKRLMDANIADATNRLKPIASPRSSARKGDPLEDWD